MGYEKEPKNKPVHVGRVRKVYICVQTNNYIMEQ